MLSTDLVGGVVDVGVVGVDVVRGVVGVGERLSSLDEDLCEGVIRPPFTSKVKVSVEWSCSLGVHTTVGDGGSSGCGSFREDTSSCNCSNEVGGVR